MAKYTGNNGNNTLVGSSKADTLDGRGGNDILDGGLGADVLIGGNGADTLISGIDGADDKLTGGAGADKFHFKLLSDGSIGNDVITDFKRAQGDTLVIEGQGVTSHFNYIDSNGDGTLDSTVIKLLSDDPSAPAGSGWALERGTITVSNAVLFAEDVQMIGGTSPGGGTQPGAGGGTGSQPGTGGSTPNTITSGVNGVDDRLSGGAGADKFLFQLPAAGSIGNDTITNFNKGQGDTLVIEGQGIKSYFNYVDSNGDGTLDSTVIKLLSDDPSAPAGSGWALERGTITVSNAVLFAEDVQMVGGTSPGGGTGGGTQPGTGGGTGSGGTTTPDPNTHHLYVSTSGSDSNDGSANAPFRTIQKAANVATAGTTVHVAAGTYNETIESYASGTSGAPVRYVSDTPGGAVIKPVGATGAIWWDMGDYVTIEGFNIDGSRSPDMRVGIGVGGSHSYVNNNEIHHLVQNGANDSNGGAGIVLGGGYYNAIDQHAIGNNVHHVGTADSDRVHGIYHQSTGSVVNNVVHDNPGSIGIVLWHDARDITIANNTVANNALGISVGSGDWYQGQSAADNVTVVNNLVYGNQGSGIQEHGLTGTNNVYQNNLVYANGSNWYLQNGLTHQGTITADPQFNGGGFDLSASSPAIDNGTWASAPAYDYAGMARPQGGGIDIGAYEWLV